MTYRTSIDVLASVILSAALTAACGGDDGGGGGGGPDGAPPPIDAAPAALGAACTVGAGCASGFCADGVCCDAACGGTCEACGASGACQPIEAGQDPDEECATDACAAGACDGAGACVITTAGEPCRAAAGECDVAEACDGINPACPADEIAPAATTCRDEAGACDVAEVCDGTTTACPADLLADAGTACGGFVCTGAAAACPAQCTTDEQCGASFVCGLGSSCIPGRRAFTTSTATGGALGGLDGADAYCQQLANTSPLLRGTYRAWLSDATGSPSTRFTQSTVPYYLPNGALLASSWSDLTDGFLARAFNVSDAGTVVGDNTPFTNTEANGTPISAASGAANCVNWTSGGASPGAWVGYSAAVDQGWTRNANTGSFTQCNVLHRLYCFQQ
ncbi:MAG: hypothetical protein KA297_17515 [Kofleriaceae bacterium]|nr:hypothetical protein [Kofleriaceae bacterium]